MNTNKELNYRLYIQREENFQRTDIHRELSRYDDIKNGEVEKVIENFKETRKNFYQGKGVLSKNPVRNNIYHLVVATGVIARLCIGAGMPHDESYTLADIYIQRADEAKTPEEVIDLMEEMQIDFAQRMRHIYKKENISRYVRHSINYIYDHLDESITMEELARLENLNPSYFSKLFQKEIGTTVKKYILKTKLETAKNMLENSNHSLSDIAYSLGFSSQSAFTAAFRKEYRESPGHYQKYYNDEQLGAMCTPDEVDKSDHGTAGDENPG